MHKKKFSYALVISALAISAVFISSTSATALSFTNSIDPTSWPNQNEPDLEMENGDPLPDFSTVSYLILKYKNNSYVFESGAPSTWGELNSYGIYGISSYTTAPVPEPATILLFGTGLAALVGFSRKKFKKM